MFFPERITKVKEGDRVLEIGPGSSPYFRSDVFLEMQWSDEETAIAQRGQSVENLITDKQIVYYNGTTFPFKNAEFDYVICSHVIEHVPNFDFFLSEIFRVGKRGYIEYPTIYFEYLYNIDVHLNIQKMIDGTLYYMSKRETNIAEFEQFRFFLNVLIEKGYLKDLNLFTNYLVEGFEWDSSFDVKKVNSINQLSDLNYGDIPQYKPSKLTLMHREFRKLIKFFS
jgi:SAM-dependent methyltransferase